MRIEVFRVLLLIGEGELFYDALNLISFSRQAERGQELPNCHINRLSLILKVMRVLFQHFLVNLICRGKVLSDCKLAQARRAQ